LVVEKEKMLRTAFLTDRARARARALACFHQSGTAGAWEKMTSISRMIRGLLWNPLENISR